MAKTTALEAAQREQYHWARAKHDIYVKLFPWYGPEAEEVCPAKPPWNPPWRDKSEAMRQIRLRANREWEELTGSRQLDSCDPGRWYTAAMAAGSQGLPVEDLRSLTPKQLSEIILPWAQAKVVSGSTDAVELSAEEFNVLRELSDVAVYQQVLAIDVDLDRKTVGVCLRRLRELGLAKRPHGKKRGDIITEAGKTFRLRISSP